MKKRLLLIFICVLIFLSATPICFASNVKLVAITFDDGPSKYTQTLLDGLKSRNAKATFFCVASMASSRIGTLERMVNEGHQIANHSSTHPDLATLSLNNIKNELAGCRKYLVKAAGEQTFCLRPPYGSYNSNVRQASEGALILWSVDTLDWKYRNADTVYNNIINNTKDGSIILLHDLYSTSVTAALRAIDTLQAKGYEFVTVNELFRRRCVTLEKGKVYTAAYNKGITLPKYEKPAAPVISFENTYSGKTVNITCSTSGAEIYYTTDGSEPNQYSKKYSGGIPITDITEFKAVSYKNNVLSDVSKRKVWVEKAKLPSFTFENGVLTLTAAENTELYINTTPYTSPINLTDTVTVSVKALAKAENSITFTVTKYGKLFTDISYSSWYYDAVSEVVNDGIMNGVDTYKFNPSGNVNRAMFATVLYRLSPDNQTTFPASSFTDVSSESWYANSVAWAKASGIVNGISETEFAPLSNITREQMCAMLNRFFNCYSYTFDTLEKAPFADDAEISDWAKNDVYTLYNIGLINGIGDNIFAPKQFATRVQCATIIVNTNKKTAF